MGAFQLDGRACCSGDFIGEAYQCKIDMLKR